MINEELKQLITDNAVALATVDSEGNPHCNVVAFVKVISEDQILITDNYMGLTRENLKKNPHLALVVWNKDWQENCLGYRIKGKAEYFSTGKWMDFVKKMPENEGEPCQGAVVVKINEIKKLC